jgi:hypothetical protein
MATINPKTKEVTLSFKNLDEFTAVKISLQNILANAGSMEMTIKGGDLFFYSVLMQRMEFGINPDTLKIQDRNLSELID